MSTAREFESKPANVLARAAFVGRYGWLPAVWLTTHHEGRVLFRRVKGACPASRSSLITQEGKVATNPGYAALFGAQGCQFCSTLGDLEKGRGETHESEAKASSFQFL